MRNFFCLFMSFRENENGNISVIFAATIMILLFGVMAALDLANLMSNKQKMQDNVDAATLAVVKAIYLEGQSQNEGQALLDQMLEIYFKSGLLQCDAIIFDDEKSKVTTNCEGEVDALISGIIGKNKLPFKVSSSAIGGHQKKYEVSFVFDISSSMENSGDIPTLERALSSFISNDLFKSTSENAVFSLIPYGGSVAFDTSFMRWLDPLTGYGLSHTFSGCFMPETTEVGRLRIDSPTERSTPIKRSNNSGNLFCPDPEMAARFFINDKSTVMPMVTNLIPSQGTASNEALMWGYRSLHPAMKGEISESQKGFPREFSPDHKKILILMTDGKPLNVNWTRGNRSQNTLGGYDRDAMKKFTDVCNEIKSNNEALDLYTIGFGRANGSNAAELKGFLEDCTLGNGAYLSATRDNLTGVVEGILSREMDVRISN